MKIAQIDRIRRRIARHNRAAHEASAGRAQLARELLAASPPWPRRRFRVEGTAVGSSRLLRRYEAARFGGKVVAILPSWREHRAARHPGPKP